MTSYSPGDDLDGLVITYEFPKVTLGVGGDRSDLSKRVFGANGLFSALHPGCDPWPTYQVASHLADLADLGPESSALYVEIPVDHLDDSLNSRTSTEGILYVSDNGEDLFTETFTLEGIPVEALFRLRTTMKSRAGTTGTAVGSEE